MKRLFFLFPVLCLVFLISCAAFQTQPALKTFNALDLYKFIDDKADSSGRRADRSDLKANQVTAKLNGVLQKINELRIFFEKEAQSGKLEISTIEELNRRGFNITLPQPEDLPNSLPDSLSKGTDHPLWP